MKNKRGIGWYEAWESDKEYYELLIIVCVGLIGSGKSYWAREFIKSHPNFVRINKDDIRTQMRKDLHKAEDQRVNESEVIRIETQMTLQTLREGLNVILDSTHLNPVHIKERLPLLISQNGYWGKVRLVVNDSFLDVPLETCLKQNNIRSGSERIEEFAIKSMWKTWKSHWEIRDYNSYLERLVEYENSEIKKPKAVCFDIDGSLALLGDRGRFEEDKVGLDLPNIPVINLCKLYLKSPDYQVIFLSGRKASCRPQTTQWLVDYLEIKKKDIILYMRQEDDNQKDYIVKQQIYRDDIEPRYFVEAFFDDRIQVVDAERSWGLFVFDLNQTRKEF